MSKPALRKAYECRCEDCSDVWTYWPQGLRYGCHLCGGQLIILKQFNAKVKKLGRTGGVR